MSFPDRGGIASALPASTLILLLALGLAIPPAWAGDGVTCRGDASGRIARAAATQGTIVPRLITSPARPLPGRDLWLSVALDLDGCDYLLGSYGARLRWDPKALEFLEVTGGATGGFTSPVINRAGASEGEIRFAHANPQGAGGRIEVLRVRLRARRALPRPDQAFRLEFTSMGGVGPKFEDLMPLLRVAGETDDRSDR